MVYYEYVHKRIHQTNAISQHANIHYFMCTYFKIYEYSRISWISFVMHMYTNTNQKDTIYSPLKNSNIVIINEDPKQMRYRSMQTYNTLFVHSRISWISFVMHTYTNTSRKEDIYSPLTNSNIIFIDSLEGAGFFRNTSPEPVNRLSSKAGLNSGIKSDESTYVLK